MIVVVDDGFLPIGAPPRRSAWCGMILDRSRTGVGTTDTSSADVASLSEIVVITVEIIHAGAESTGPHELVHDRFLVEKCRCSAAGLIGVVASDHPLPGRS